MKRNDRGNAASEQNQNSVCSFDICHGFLQLPRTLRFAATTYEGVKNGGDDSHVQSQRDRPIAFDYS